MLTDCQDQMICIFFLGEAKKKYQQLTDEKIWLLITLNLNYMKTMNHTQVKGAGNVITKPERKFCQYFNSQKNINGLLNDAILKIYRLHKIKNENVDFVVTS